ncbi:hypothetical protein [Phenylobacterium sp.]|uniref:hypothetical protein n=1 Tax=Phenylobacterium sp. TaxID=1871053 RepID=UPI0012034873|nr:hypothetical protein [Phenylobacterium sp.]THD58833.1 MAG: hypothetical protein E8A49_17720 [Phenylobacterium sp.]
MAQDRPPLATLLSWALVAFTIELDNAFEARMPHSTTEGGGAGPWLVSWAMWANVLRYVPESGTTVGELRRAARTDKLPLDGLRRWGYLTIDAGPGRRVSGAPRPGWVLRPTRHAERAGQVWAPLPDEIEARWSERFGLGAMARLRAALAAVSARIETPLPDFMPILGYAMTANSSADTPAAPSAADPELPMLLARALIAFTHSFEAISPISLAVVANVLSRLDAAEGQRLRDLPVAAGVAPPAVAMAVGFLEKRGLAEIATLARARTVRLTARGEAARAAAAKRLTAVNAAWIADPLGAELAAALALIVGDGTPGGSPLFAGLQPDPRGWRAKSWPPATLPAYPMILHRGGYPDGA